MYTPRKNFVENLSETLWSNRVPSRFFNTDEMSRCVNTLPIQLINH